MNDVLQTFADAFDRCWLCGVKAINTWPPRLEIHHIARGCNRKKGQYERCNLVRTCQRCHAERLDGMPVAMQYALKLLHDRDGYDRVVLNLLRGRADDAVDELDVFAAYIQLVDSGYPYPKWS